MRSTPASRISPKVIFFWRVSSGMPHDSADHASREAARYGGRRRGGAIASALDSVSALADLLQPRRAKRASGLP